MDDIAEQLTTALRLLISGQEFSEIPDVAVYADVADQWNKGYCDELAAVIRDGNIGPSHTEIVDYPKNDIAVRPLARFSARDRLVYDALIFGIAAEVDKARHSSVYSYRWNHRAEIPISWKTSWTMMRRRAKVHMIGNRKLKMASLDAATAPFLGSTKKAADFQSSARSYTALRHKYQVEIGLLSKDIDWNEAQGLLRSLNSAYEQITATDVPVPNRAFALARKRIQQGLAS
ncbi:hypothetical protein [Streptomyces sp. SCL15-4]|uniref:hypothetical protein n=1 Tax=Streptomyces sp. SCL15-4 TaxID=2967221 RepID=UPI002966CDB2|nr:hypothetical protein [Streptomyces sp. SCL15-4]